MGPTQLSWPACQGLSWRRQRQSRGLPAGALGTRILFSEAPQMRRDQNKTGTSAPTVREPTSLATGLPRRWLIPTSAPTCVPTRSTCTQRVGSRTHLLPALWGPGRLCSSISICPALAPALQPFVQTRLTLEAGSMKPSVIPSWHSEGVSPPLNSCSLLGPFPRASTVCQ